MDEREIINQALSDAYMQRYKTYRASYSFILALFYIAIAAAIVCVAVFF